MVPRPSQRLRGGWPDARARAGAALRASDADRDLVLNVLSDAASDGRLTPAEHEERSGQALAARTLGELALLTADLAPPSGQPIKLYPGRAVMAVGGRERREGRWVVPDAFPVTALFGDVVLDLRDAVLASQRIVIYATAICGQVRLIVPAGVNVEMTGRSYLGIRSVRGHGRVWASGGPPGVPPRGSIEVRTLALGGAVKVVTPRRPWRRLLGRVA